MTKPAITSTTNRARGSTARYSYYVSDDDDASQTEAGDMDQTMASHIELIDLDGDGSPEPIDLTGDDFALRYESPHLPVNIAAHDSLSSARTQLDAVIEPGDCVECTHGERDAFLRIVKITQKHGEIYLHGDLLQRTGDVDERFPKAGGPFTLHALMPRTKNELCALLQVPSAARISLGTTLVTRHISEAGVVRSVIFTNKHHKELNGQTLGEFFLKHEWKQKQDEGTLFCRRKYIEETDARKKQVVSFQIRWIDESECSPGHGISLEQIFTDFYQPPNVLHATPASKESAKRKREVIDISSDEDTTSEPKPNAQIASRKKKTLRKSIETVTLVNDTGTKETFTFQMNEKPTKSGRVDKKYISADLCAGAGGTSTGAKMAGLEIKYLLDFDSDACKTLRLNFPGAAVLEMDIGAFSVDDTTDATGGDHVDVMHISFPCQGHSAANTGINVELDHERIATAYGALENILKKCKPRCLTLEQVPGILWKKDGQHFRAQVCALAEAGYSLRWKVVNFAQHGNSQARKRVIVIAACPGQTLPPFPTPTHGPGLKPFVTVADVLAEVPKLPAVDPLSYAFVRDPREYPPWDANLPLRSCITGDGGAKNWHPSGTRNFSFQERSQLQGFPATHQYYFRTKHSLGKQIGNAVPPVFAKALFEAVIQKNEFSAKGLLIVYLGPTPYPYTS